MLLHESDLGLDQLLLAWVHLHVRINRLPLLWIGDNLIEDALQVLVHVDADLEVQYVLRKVVEVLLLAGFIELRKDLVELDDDRRVLQVPFLFLHIRRLEVIVDLLAKLGKAKLFDRLKRL